MRKNRKGSTEAVPGTFEGMSQYRPPLCFELVGKTFELVMDTGYDYEISFNDRKTLRFGEKDGDAAEYEYDCLKADDDTYFVNFEVTGADPRAGQSFVLDLEQYLVTSKKAWQYKKTDGKYVTNPFETPHKAEDGDAVGEFCVGALLRKKDDENPSAIIFGDQYAFASSMIGYSSSQYSVDTRSLEFLSDSMLLLNGEKSVLDLKNGRVRNSGLYKKSLDEIYSKRHGFFALLVIAPALVLFSMAMIVRMRRRKFNQSGRK